MELYMLLSIVDRKKEKSLLELYEKLNMTMVYSSLGEGTAKAEHLLLYDLEQQEKSLVCALASDVYVKQLIEQAKRRLYIDIPGNGIMLAVPVKSAAGGRNLAYITQGQTFGGEKMDMKFDHELIVVVLNEGFSDTVMDAARAAGATGGTVFHAKGTGVKKSQKFYGVSLAQEKDIIYIVAASSRKADIMKRINDECGTQTSIGAICFSLPVVSVAGIRQLDDE